MTEDQVIAEVKVHSDRLSGLVSNPHPGLFTWMACFEHELKWLADYREKGVDYANERSKCE